MVILFSEVASYSVFCLPAQQFFSSSMKLLGCKVLYLLLTAFVKLKLKQFFFCLLWEREEGEPRKKGDPDSQACSQLMGLLFNWYAFFETNLLSLFPLVDQWKRMSKVLRSAGHDLVPVKENLIDTIWTDRPQRPCKPLIMLDLSYTGEKLYCRQVDYFYCPVSLWFCLTKQ